MNNKELAKRIITTLSDPLADIENMKEDGQNNTEIAYSEPSRKIDTICEIISSIIGGEFTYSVFSDCFKHESKNEYGSISQTIAIDKVTDYICKAFNSIL